MGYSSKIFALLCGSFLAAIIFTGGCAPSSREPAVSASAKKESTSQRDTDKRPLRIVATYSILGDWVQTIGGEEIKLTVLVGAEGDAHTYEPIPRDSVALAEADILFENGLGFEVWLDRLFQASGSAARRVVVTETIKPRELAVSESRTEIDPHVWHLPDNALLMVETIAGALEMVDPANASKYRDRQKSYVAQLMKLDAWIAKQAKSVPVERRKLVTTHDTFGYLVGVVRPSHPSPRSSSANFVAVILGLRFLRHLCDVRCSMKDETLG